MTLKPMDLMDVLKFRLYFEPGNIIQFMNSCNENDIIELERTYTRMKDRAQENRAFYTADYDFHRIIARGTKNPIVISINEMLTEVLISSQELTNLKIGPEVGLKYHEEIIKAVKNQDPEMAALIMTRHIEATIKRVQSCE